MSKIIVSSLIKICIDYRENNEIKNNKYEKAEKIIEEYLHFSVRKSLLIGNYYDSSRSSIHLSVGHSNVYSSGNRHSLPACMIHFQ